MMLSLAATSMSVRSNWATTSTLRPSKFSCCQLTIGKSCVSTLKARTRCSTRLSPTTAGQEGSRSSLVTPPDRPWCSTILAKPLKNLETAAPTFAMSSFNLELNEHDLPHLKRNGFLDFWGVVDVQTLIRPATIQSGIEFCSQYVWGHNTERNEYEAGYERVDIPNKNKIRIKWATGFNWYYQREDWEKLSLYHSCQEVLTHYATLVKIALKITEI